MPSLEAVDSESLLYASMEHSPIGMALTRIDGTWIDVNPALCEILGYSKAELMAAGFKKVTLPEDREATVQTARKLVASGQKSVRLEQAAGLFGELESAHPWRMPDQNVGVTVRLPPLGSGTCGNLGITRAVCPPIVCPRTGPGRP